MIPASAVQVRYAVPDGPGTRPFFDSLEESPPKEVPVYEQQGGSIQPLWVSVKIPAHAKAGEYSGMITVSATGKEAISVPLELTLFDWSLPFSSEQLTACMDIAQSPDSVAMAYNVPMWAEAHLKLLDKSFSLLAPLAVKTLYIPCIRRTHFGNEHAMVRWIRNDAGELEPDFSVAEKYLDLAMKHLGRIPGVIFYCWEPPESMGHAGTGATDIHDRIPLITLFDPASGRQLPRQGPGFGTPESKAFWKRLTDGAMAMLRKRGLENSMYIGLIGDHRPTRLAMDDIGNGLARPRWALHSHIYAEKWQGHEIGFITALWGVSYSPADPSSGYCFGWSNPLWVNYYPREMSLTSTLTEHRIKLENYLGARRAYTPFVVKGMGVRGLGRLGADFWNALRDERGWPRGSLAVQYPESYWGQLNLNYGIPYLLGRGREGPVATIRSEAFRENIQEVEARIYLEKALLDEKTKASMGEDLATRCRKALNERIRMCLHSGGEGEPWFISSDWSQRTALLFSLAAETVRALGELKPNPDMSPEASKRR